MEMLAIVILAIWSTWSVLNILTQSTRISKLEETVAQQEANLNKMLEAQRYDRGRIAQVEKELE